MEQQPQPPKDFVAIVIGGAGMKIPFYAGALKHLYREQKVRPDYVVGTSSGALTGRFVAADEMDVYDDFMKALRDKGIALVSTSEFFDPTMQNVNRKAIVKRILPRNKLKLLAQLVANEDGLGADILKNVRGIKSLADNTPLLRLLESTVDWEKDKKSPCYFEVCWASLYDGEHYVKHPSEFASKQDYILGILASATMPLVWRSIPEIRLADGTVVRNNVDGGLLYNSYMSGPIDYASRIGVSNRRCLFIVINSGSGYVSPEAMTGGILQEGPRALIDVGPSGKIRDDLKSFLETNHRVRSNAEPQTTLNGKPLYDYDTVLVYPKQHELGDTLNTTPELFDQRFQLGYTMMAQEWSKYVNLGIAK